jgi:hypothetical protein
MPKSLSTSILVDLYPTTTVGSVALLQRQCDVANSPQLLVSNRFDLADSIGSASIELASACFAEVVEGVTAAFARQAEGAARKFAKRSGCCQSTRRRAQLSFPGLNTCGWRQYATFMKNSDLPIRLASGLLQLTAMFSSFSRAPHTKCRPHHLVLLWSVTAAEGGPHDNFVTRPHEWQSEPPALSAFFLLIHSCKSLIS